MNDMNDKDGLDRRAFAEDARGWIMDLLRRVIMGYRVTTILGSLGASGFALMVLMTLDYLANFEFWGRGILLVIMAGIAATTARLIRARLPRLRTPTDLAWRAEHVQSGLGGIYVSGVEVALERYHGSALLADRLLRAVSVMRLDAAALGEPGLRRRSALIILAAGVILFAAVVAHPDFALRHSLRVLLPFARIDAATRTRISVNPAGGAIVAGDSFQLEVRATGELPDYAEIELIGRADADPVRYRLLPVESEAPGERVFGTTVEHILDPFEFRVYAGDARTFWHEVEVLVPPRITEMEVVLKPPSYSRSSPLVLKNPSKVELFESGSIELNLTADRPVSEARLEIGEGIAGKAEGMSARFALFANSLPGDSGNLRPVLRGQNGVAGPAGRTLEIVKRRDLPPVLSVDWPGRSTEATATEEIRFAVRMEDDLALERLDIHVSLGGETETIFATIPFSLTRQDSAEFLLPLESFPLEVGDVVSVRLNARDENPAGEGSSRAVLIEIVPYERFYRFDPGAALDAMLQGLSVNLRKFIRLQKEIITLTADKMGGTSDDLKDAGERQARLKADLDSEIARVEDHLRAESTGGAEIMTAMELASQFMGEAVTDLKAGRGPEGYRHELEVLNELTKAFRALLTIFTPRQDQPAGSGALQEDEQVPRDEIPRDTSVSKSQDRRNDRSETAAVRDEAGELLKEARRLLEGAAVEPASDGGTGDTSQNRKAPGGGGMPNPEAADSLAGRAERLADRLSARGDPRGDQLRRLAQRLRDNARAASRPRAAQTPLQGNRRNQAGDGASGILVGDLGDLLELATKIFEDAQTKVAAEEILDRLLRNPESIPPQERDFVRRYFEELNRIRSSP